MNDFFRKIRKAVNNPWLVLAHIANKLYWMFSDKTYLSILFKAYLGKWIDWKNPKTFNEKLQWLKVYDRNPEYTKMVDKVGAKEYVASKIGKEYIIPTLGVWDSPDDIELDKLPNQFVLKCSHNSGGLFICKDKNKLTDLEWNRIKENLRKGLKVNFYMKFREWPYKNVERKILAEKYIVDDSGCELKDYKFFCFDGTPKYVLVATDRSSDVKFDFFDTEFHHMSFKQIRDKLSNNPIERPRNFDKMLKIAAILSENIPHVRVDMYNINGKIYFGEMTFFNNSGFEGFVPKEWDYKFGEWIKLPNTLL